MKCTECNNEMVLKNTNIEYPVAGLKLVLVGLPMPVCKNCGNKAIAIPAIKNLYTLVARIIIDDIPRPTGEQIKFLRKFMGMTQETFHSYFTQEKASAETVSRWENDQNKPADTTIFLIKKMVEEFIIKQNHEYESLVAEITQKDSLVADRKPMATIDFITHLNKVKSNKYSNKVKIKYTGTVYAMLA